MQSTRIIRKCHITEMLLKYPLFWLELKVSGSENTFSGMVKPSTTDCCCFAIFGEY